MKAASPDQQQSQQLKKPASRQECQQSKGQTSLTLLLLFLLALVFLPLNLFIRYIKLPQDEENREQSFKQYFYGIDLSQRVKLEEPAVRDPYLVLWTIMADGQGQGQGQGEQKCVFISSTNLVTRKTIGNVKQFLDSEFGIVFVLADWADVTGNGLLEKELAGWKKQKMILSSRLDSDLDFGQQIKRQCPKIIYTFGHHYFNSQMLQNLKQQYNKQDNTSIFFSSVHNQSCLTQPQSLPSLHTSNLSILSSSQISTYLYILPTLFFSILTPTNFAYFARYTMEEILLLSNLVIFWGKGDGMRTSGRVLHGVGVVLGQSKRLGIEAPLRDRNVLCFVSYPVVPSVINEQDAMEYISSIVNQQPSTPSTPTPPSNSSSSPSIIVYLPHTPSSSPHSLALHLLASLQANPSLRIKLRLVPEAASTHAVYESVYMYCPKGAVVVASRHHVRFAGDALERIAEGLTVKYHYYWADLRIRGGGKIGLGIFEGLSRKINWKENRNFEDKLRHLQIFKSDLMKMMPFWALKSAEIDFFHTEAIFVSHMLQYISNFDIGVIAHEIATVNPSPITPREQFQIRNIRLYKDYAPLSQPYLIPYLWNSLENPALHPQAPQKIPALIHQIWLGKLAISPLRSKLHSSIKEANPDFAVRLWRVQNVTKEIFPIAYNLLTTVYERQKWAEKSIFAMAADVLRYEILLHFGGIYVDFKFEGRKPLNNFLKYELIFADLDIMPYRLGSPKPTGNPFMAATPNNYHLKLILTELIIEQTLNFHIDLPFLTGALVVRKSLTDRQIFTRASFGYHLSIPNTYQEPEDYCGGRTQKFDGGQEVFEVEIAEGDRFRVGVPCRLYEVSYLVLVSPLRGTWLKKKENVKD